MDRALAPEHLIGAFGEIQLSELPTVAQLTDLIATRTNDALTDAKQWSDFWGTVAKSLLGLTAAVFLGVLYFVLRRRVAMPLMRMTGPARRRCRCCSTVAPPHPERVRSAPRFLWGMNLRRRCRPSGLPR